MSQIIITGDDFGLNHEVNEAVEAQYRAGRLTQASLMIHGREMEEARRIAQRNPGLCVGLHLTLCAGTRVGRTALTDAQGQFEPSPAMAGWRYFAKRDLRTAIREEIGEQFGRFVEAGFPAIYWDGHTHLHLHPVVFAESLPIAVAHRFQAVRLVQSSGNGVLGWIFNRLSAATKARLRKTGVRFSEQTFGLRESGRVDDVAMADFARQAAAWDLVEIYYHPGVDGPMTGKWLAGLRLTDWAELLESSRKIDARS